MSWRRKALISQVEPKEPLVRRTEAQRILGVSRHALGRMIKQEALKPIVVKDIVGHDHLYFPISDVIRVNDLRKELGLLKENVKSVETQLGVRK
jgi:hypothetical protein